MKTLLIAELAVVALAGLPLALFPSATISLLLGTELDHQVGTFVGHNAGAALLMLGIACWMARNESQDRATTELMPWLLFSFPRVRLPGCLT